MRLDPAFELTQAIQIKDRYTAGHAKRVAYYALKIARAMPAFATADLERLRLAAVLHDVGKIGIEDHILKKPAPLEPDEWRVMQTHPELGHEILDGKDGLSDVVDGVRFHHERWDGRGYPLGLQGGQIPWMARIIAVADTYDAMVSTRPYRKGMNPGLAYDEILRQSGSQFDPEVVEAFSRAFDPAESCQAVFGVGAALPSFPSLNHD